MSRFLSPRFQALTAYVPGEQPRDRKYIKLNTNESPFPPSPGVIAAVTSSAVADLRLYSDPACRQLRQMLAQVYGMDAQSVYLANGSDDILNFAFLAFGQQGVVFPAISYGFYSVFAALHGLSAEALPLKPDFSIDPADYCGKGKLVVLANPNAPTGLYLPPNEIERIVAGNPDSVVLIDEAYIDFGGESCLPLLARYDNLLVVRTYSKSRSMAGARLGFAFGSPALIADLEKLRYSTNPYNLNSLTQLAGTAALAEADYYRENCRRIIENRAYAAKALGDMGFTLTDSMANFLFAKSDRISGEALYLRLKEAGILIRHFQTPEICDYNRITVGSRNEMERFVAAVKNILEGEA